MNQQQENLLVVVSRILQFATYHPFAATGIFGAAVGSLITYKMMMYKSSTTNGIFTPKVYKFAISRAELQQMLDDPTLELRWDMSTMSIIVISEQTPKQLPDIVIE